MAVRDVPAPEAGVNLFVLGPARSAERKGGAVALPRLGLALAAYLLLDCPDRCAFREDVGAFLWERADRSRQVGNLRQLLFRIHAAEDAAGVRLFETSGREISLRADGDAIDLRRFQRAIVADDGAAAGAAYGGDLLAGFTARGERLDAWLMQRRMALRAALRAVLVPALEAQAAGPVNDAMMVAAKRILEFDPRQDVAYRALIQACGERGDRAGAAHYRRQRDRLIDRQRALRVSAPLIGRPLADALAMVEAPHPIAPPSAIPRAIVSAHAPSYASPAGRELVEEMAADLAIRIAQTRALTVLAAQDPALGEGTGRVDYLIEARLAQGQGEAAYLRLIALPTRQILWGTSFSDAQQYSERARLALFSILRHIEEREVALTSGSESDRFAYRATLEAQRLLGDLDLPSIRRARRLLRSAHAVAPEFIPAIAALARSHVMEWLVRAPFEFAPLEIAEHFAKRAISLSPDDHRGYHELGLVRVYSRRLDDGVESLKRASGLSPDDKGARADLADALVFGGQAQEAIALLSDCVRSFDPGDDYICWVLAGAYFAREDYEASSRLVARMNNPSPAFRISAAARALGGDVAGARRIARQSMDFNPDFDLKAWLAIAPCQNREFLSRYTEGLHAAGFA